MSHWWESKVPHWWLGSINLVLSVVAVSVPLAGRRVVDTPFGDFLEILWGLSLLPGLIVPVLYLRSYSKISRFFSFVAWATLTLWLGALAFSLAFVGA
jgi:hypothetical protein